MNSYKKLNFINGSAPALNASNLNHMDDGIEAATEAVTALENRTAPVEDEIQTAKGNFENLSAKLDNLSLNYITAEQFGAKGDGITDDTAALQTMFDYASKNNCAISLSANKIYIISNTLRYDTAKANFNGNWATIKVVDDCPKREESYFISQDQQIKEQKIEGKWSLNSLITINITSGENARYNMGTFKQLIVDCNCGQAKHAIKIENEGKTNYAHIMVKNPALYGICSYGGNEATFSYIHGCRSGVSELSSKLITKGWLSIDQRLRSTMLYLGCADTYVSDCVAVDFENGFLTGASDNHFNKCHAWCSNENIMQCSASFIIWGGAATFIQCTVDSTKFGYKFYNRGCAIVVGGMSAYNDIYKENIENFGVPTLFYFEKESTYKSELVGLNTIISSSSFKTVEGLSCNFDNLTDENDNKLSIDYKPEAEFESVHVIELSDTYTKSEIDSELAKKINEEDVYTAEEADDHFQRILTAGDNIKIDDNKQGEITISADLSKKYDAANVELGSGDLSLHSENVPVTSAKFNYQKVGDFVMLTFTVTFSAATMSAAKSYSLLGLPYRNDIILRKPAITTSKNKLGIAIAANTATLTIITQGEAVTISDGESIQETLIYKIQK